MIRNARDVGALIRDGRTKAGWDQKTLARYAGVSRLWINEVEQGKPGASLGRILNTLAALGIELQPRFPHEGPAEEEGYRPNSAALIQRVIGKPRGSPDE
jgi:HTH-type transcriptional regulator/antitoxin HipB